MARSFLRWAGSKRKLLGHLAPYWGEGFPRYIEPFVGSACLFFHLRPAAAVLGDLNSELIRTYQTVRAHPHAVHAALIALSGDEKTYYRIRRSIPDPEDYVQQAARFIYLNRYCFNGLYRTNLNGEFNVPYGGAKSGSLPSLRDLLDVVDACAAAEFHHGDFETILHNQVQHGDFVYLDPPFAVENVRIFNQYGPHTFGLRDLSRLRRCLELIEQRGAFFLLSYAECQAAVDEFAHWPRRSVRTQRNISGFATHRRVASELIITNIPETITGIEA